MNLRAIPTSEMAATEVITAKASHSVGSRRELSCRSGKGRIQTRANTEMATAAIRRLLVVGLDGCVMLGWC